MVIDNKILVKIESIYAKVFDEKITHKEARNEVKKVLIQSFPIKLNHSKPCSANRRDMLSVVNGKQSIVPGFHNNKHESQIKKWADGGRDIGLRRENVYPSNKPKTNKT